MENEGEDSSGVVWNFDDAQSQLIFFMKISYLKNIERWDLESAYWSLWRLLGELEPLFDETIAKELNEEFDKIIEVRNQVSRFTNLSEEEKGYCGELLDKFYRRISKEAVGEQYYYRKKKAYIGL